MDEGTTLALRVVVTGASAQTSSYLARTPDMPWLILRDPPGDASFAEWASGQTLDFSAGLRIGNDMGVEEEATVKFGWCV